MKKLMFSLVLAVLIGVGFTSLSFASPEGQSSTDYYNRTIPLKSGFASHSASNGLTLIVAHGGQLRYISGSAASANSVWTIYDAASITAVSGNSLQGILIEGGQATQYGSEGPIDLGSSGINFVNGLVVASTTADITVLYY